MGQTGCSLVPASTANDDGERSGGTAIIPGSHLDVRCVADGIVERVGGSGGHSPLGGGGDLCGALGKPAGDG